MAKPESYGILLKNVYFLHTIHISWIKHHRSEHFKSSHQIILWKRLLFKSLYLMPLGYSQLLYFDSKVLFWGEYSSLKARNNAYRGNLTESCYDLTCRKENTVVPSFPFKRTKPITDAPLNLSKPNYLSRATSPNTITVGIRASTYELGRDTNIQSTAMANYLLPLSSEGQWCFPAECCLLLV